MRRFLALLALPFLAACGGPEEEVEADLTRAQKDSIVAESGLPGSQGVGRAMDAARDANARSATHDSLLD